LPVAHKKDSTGICFIGERPFRAFLNRYLPTEPGPIKDEKGQVVGEHMGLAFYTLGQRRGLGIGGVKGRKTVEGASGAWYVAKKDIKNNALIVVQGAKHPWLYQQKLNAEQASWVAGTPPEKGDYQAKVRYRQKDTACELVSSFNSDFSLQFKEPQWAVTPGQSAVLYDGAICLGGGIII